MAITWSQSSGHLSVGVEVHQYPPTIQPGHREVILTAVYYVRSDGYGHSWSSVLHRAGAITGDVSFQFSSGFGETKTAEVNRHQITVPLEYGREKTAVFQASVGPIWNGGAPIVEVAHRLPARAYEVPHTPSNVRAVRASDAVVNVSWQVASDAAHPIFAQGIERWSASSGKWVRVGTVGGGDRAWADTSVRAGDLYVYRVWGDNGRRGQMAQSGRVFTTPTPPRDVSAAKISSGAIVVRWERTAPYTEGTFVVYDNGIQVGTVSASSSSWTHSAPSTTSAHTYAVAMREPGGLTSARSAPSNTVQLLTVPGVPQQDGPTGTVGPGSVRLSWRHAPLDTTTQTRAKVRYRAVGASSWTTLTVSAQQWRDVTLSVGSYEWQVRTWGAFRPGQEAGASPWSAVSRLLVVDLPVVGVVAPAVTVRTSQVSVSWSYHQGQGYGQVGAQVELAPIIGGAVGSPIETRAVNGNATSVALSTRLPDGSRWQVRVTVTSSVGLTSTEVMHQFSVDYPEPAAPTVTVTWDETTGSARLKISNPSPAGGQAAAASNRVARSIDAGATWEKISDRVALNATLADSEGLSCGETLYRVEALTVDGAAAATEVTLLADSQSLWVSGGPGFALCVGLAYDPVHSLRAGLVHRTVRHFAGRRLGVEMSGMQQERSLSLSATLLDEDWGNIQRLEALAQMPGPFLYRDPMGRRIFCSLNGVEMSRALSGAWTIKASIEEVSRE